MVARVGIYGGLEGVSVVVEVYVAVSIDEVGEGEDPESVAVTVGGRIFGVAESIDGVCDGSGVCNTLFDSGPISQLLHPAAEAINTSQKIKKGLIPDPDRTQFYPYFAGMQDLSINLLENT
jgi:hypothetical protein